MSEFIGLGYFAECPGVFLDVVRMGPSTGLPTRTSQGDIALCARASHGDTLHICLYPGTMEECFQFTYQAFDLAERFQTPVFVVSDLDLGMQNWASKPFAYPEGGLRPGQGARPGGPGRDPGLGPLQGPGRGRHPLAHPARHPRRQGRLLHPRHRPQRRAPSIPRSPRTSSTWSTASNANSSPPGPSCPSRSWTGPGCARGILAYGSSRSRGGGGPGHPARPARQGHRLPARARPALHRRSDRVHPRP